MRVGWQNGEVDAAFHTLPSSSSHWRLSLIHNPFMFQWPHSWHDEMVVTKRWRQAAAGRVPHECWYFNKITLFLGGTMSMLKWVSSIAWSETLLYILKRHFIKDMILMNLQPHSTHCSTQCSSLFVIVTVICNTKVLRSNIFVCFSFWGGYSLTEYD